MLLSAVNIALLLFSRIMHLKTLCYWYFVVLLLATACTPKRHAVTGANGDFVGLHDSLQLSHSESSQLIAPYKAKLDSVMNAVIGMTAVEFVKPKEYMAANGRPEMISFRTESN